MPYNEIVNSFSDSFIGVSGYVSDTVPSIIIAILIVFIGWVIGSIVAKLVARGINSVSVITKTIDTIFGESFRRAGMNLDFGKFIGILVEIFIIVIFAIPALDLLGLNAINVFFTQVLTFIPKIIIAATIVVLAAFIAEVVEDIVVGATRATKLKSAKFAGLLAKWSIWVLAIIAALQQLNISLDIIFRLFEGLILAISIAIGLAFGFGGKNAAERLIDRITDSR